MLLGDIIERLEDEAVAVEAIMGAGDLALLAKVGAAATDMGLTAGAFAARSVHLFTGTATDEDWVSLVGAMGQASDPGAACLKRMVEFALRPAPAVRACGHGHG